MCSPMGPGRPHSGCRQNYEWRDLVWYVIAHNAPTARNVVENN